MNIAMPEWPRRHRITVSDYYRMGDAGLFAPDERVELINGEIVDMPPIGSPHASVLEHLAAILSAAVGNRTIVRQQLPVHLTEDSEPQPDIALVRPRQDRYRSAHPRPEDVILLVEISGSTLRYDRETKVPLYARCAIPEAWVIDVRRSKVHFYRDPRDGRYAVASTSDLRDCTAAVAGAVIDLSPLAAPDPEP